MPTETQELRIRITLDDQATTHLQTVRSQLANIGSGPVNQGFQQAARSADQFGVAIGRLSREFLGIGRTAMDLAKVIGPLPIAVATIGYEFIRQLAAMKEWSAQMTQINNAARMAGVGVGAFRNIQDAMRMSGISAQQSAQMMQQLSRTLSEAARPGSAIQTGLLQMAGPQFAGAMQDAMIKMVQMKDATDRVNYLRRLGLNVYANEFARTHDDMRARTAQFLFLQQWGAEQLINQKKDIAKLDAETTKNMEYAGKLQDDLTEKLETEARLRKQIYDQTMIHFAGVESASTKALSALFDYMQKNQQARMTWERTHPGQAVPTDVPGERQLIAPKGSGALIEMPSIQDIFRAPGKIKGFQTGGIITQPTMGLVGEAGPEAILPLTGGAGASEHTESVGENTKQLRMLNDQLEEILNPSKTGRLGDGMGGLGGLGAGSYGGGGVSGGGTGVRAGQTGGITPAAGEPGGAAVDISAGARFGMNPMWDQPATPAQAALRNQISMGLAGGGLKGENIKAPAYPWPAAPGTAGAGYGATGPTTAGGEGISGPTSIAALENNPRAQAAIARFAAAFPNVQNPKSQIYSLVIGESNMGRDMGRGQYRGYFQLGDTERGGVGRDQFSAMTFDQQLDAYIANAKHADPSGQQLRNLGLFNAAGDINKQTWDPNRIVYPAGSRGALANLPTWGAASGAGGASTVGGIEKYYGRNDPEVNRQIAAAGKAAPSTAQTAGQQPAAQPGGYGPFGPTAGGPSGVKPDILAQAALIARTGDQAAVQKFLNGQGINVDARDCGEFVAGVVKASGGTPPASYATGSAWRTYGQEIAKGQAKPGDVFSSQYYTYGPNKNQPIPPGAVQGGHAAMVGPGGYNPKTGEYDVIQADPLKEYQSPMTGYAVRGTRGPTQDNWPTSAPVADMRKTIDDMNNGGARQADNTGTITIKHDRRPWSKRASNRPAFRHISDQRQQTMVPADDYNSQIRGSDIGVQV